jgi:hypothetical protein
VGAVHFYRVTRKEWSARSRHEKIKRKNWRAQSFS